MEQITAQPLFMLRRGPAPAADSDAANETRDRTHVEEPGGDDKIVCRECGQIITSARERIAVQGSHEHTFANPAGILFQIGCFRRAAGCAHVGPAALEWSWFSGYSWQVAVCAACLTHLGWLYEAADRESFYGFILNRLIRAN